MSHILKLIIYHQTNQLYAVNLTLSILGTPNFRHLIFT